MDTLRGSLDTFALADIVRLIAASGRTGRLTADSFRLKGRVFITEGTISYATTRGDDGDIEELRRMTTSRTLRRERRGRKEASPGQTLEDLIEQQVVEVFVRLMRMQGGKFVFDEGATTRAYGNGAALQLDVDKVVRQADERIAEWEDIETVVPSSSTQFCLNGDLADDEFEVTLDAKSWTFLAAIGESASVQDLAERLRIFEFPAARKVAEFVRRGLLATVEGHVESSPVSVTVAHTDATESAAAAAVADATSTDGETRRAQPDDGGGDAFSGPAVRMDAPADPEVDAGHGAPELRNGPGPEPAHESSTEPPPTPPVQDSLSDPIAHD